MLDAGAGCAALKTCVTRLSPFGNVDAAPKEPPLVGWTPGPATRAADAPSPQPTPGPQVRLVHPRIIQTWRGNAVDPGRHSSREEWFQGRLRLPLPYLLEPEIVREQGKKGAVGSSENRHVPQALERESALRIRAPRDRVRKR